MEIENLGDLLRNYGIGDNEADRLSTLISGADAMRIINDLSDGSRDILDANLVLKKYGAIILENHKYSKKGIETMKKSILGKDIDRLVEDILDDEIIGYGDPVTMTDIIDDGFEDEVIVTDDDIGDYDAFDAIVDHIAEIEKLLPEVKISQYADVLCRLRDVQCIAKTSGKDFLDI